MRKILLTTIGIICFFIGEAFAESMPRAATTREAISDLTNTSAVGNTMNMRSMRQSSSYFNINHNEARGGFYTSGKVGKSYPINHSERGAAAISQ